MRIGTALDAARLLAPVYDGSEVEVVAAIHLDADLSFLALTVELPGARDGADLPVATLLGRALRIGSQALILAHNHPSGNASPSQEDLRGTRRLAEAAAPLGIRLHDHLIFAGDECVSLRELKLL
ncbi:MAG TPA: JAB domain-containing protein [Allosphingosinicella sp.]|jgi:DNA repair protein RadC